MSKKSDIVSGMGFGMSFVINLINAIHKLGGDNKKIHEALKEGSPLIDELAQLIVVIPNHPTTIFFRGWKVLEHTSRRIASVASLEPVPFFKNDENHINGIVRRAQSQLDAYYGLEDAEYILEHQAEIPQELQEFHLVFPGTILEDLDNGDRYVPCLIKDDSGWYLDFVCFVNGRSSGYRLVRPRKG